MYGPEGSKTRHGRPVQEERKRVVPLVETRHQGWIKKQIFKLTLSNSL